MNKLYLDIETIPVAEEMRGILKDIYTRKIYKEMIFENN